MCLRFSFPPHISLCAKALPHHQRMECEVTTTFEANIPTNFNGLCGSSPWKILDNILPMVNYLITPFGEDIDFR